MCRNIKTLANFAPPATDDEIRASAIQFVRKLSGSNKPSRANEEAFNRAVDEVFSSARRLIDSLATTATPRNREDLEALPGVGRKTANVVLNTVFGEPTLAVDTHVFRLANRLAIAPGKTPREVEDELMRVVPDRFLLHAHHWLILHGRYVCMARKPLCGVCVLVDLCPYEPKNLLSRG